MPTIEQWQEVGKAKVLYDPNGRESIKESLLSIEKKIDMLYDVVKRASDVLKKNKLNA